MIFPVVQSDHKVTYANKENGSIFCVFWVLFLCISQNMKGQTTRNWTIGSKGAENVLEPLKHKKRARCFTTFGVTFFRVCCWCCWCCIRWRFSIYSIFLGCLRTCYLSGNPQNRNLPEFFANRSFSENLEVSSCLEVSIGSCIIMLELSIMPFIVSQSRGKFVGKGTICVTVHPIFKETKKSFSCHARSDTNLLRIQRSFSELVRILRRQPSGVHVPGKIITPKTSIQKTRIVLIHCNKHWNHWNLDAKFFEQFCVRRVKLLWNVSKRFFGLSIRASSTGATFSSSKEGLPVRFSSCMDRVVRNLSTERLIVELWGIGSAGLRSCRTSLAIS